MLSSRCKIIIKEFLENFQRTDKTVTAVWGKCGPYARVMLEKSKNAISTKWSLLGEGRHGSQNNHN